MRSKNLTKLMENKYIKHISLSKIMNRNRDSGGQFFSAGATAFFNSHYTDHCFYLDPKQVGRKINYGYFITSEKAPIGGAKRNHTIRRVNLNTGRAIHTVGEFNSIPTINKAYEEMLELLLSERIGG